MTTAHGTNAGSRRRLPVFSGFSYLLFAVVAAAIVYPFLRVVTSLFYSHGRLTIDPIRQAIHFGGLANILLNTAVVVGCGGAIALVAGSILAWLNERTDARIPGVTDVVPIVPFLIPSVAASIGWVLLFAPQAGLANSAIRAVVNALGGHLESGPFNIYTMYGLILAYSASLVPYVFLLVSAGLRNLPADLEEQARIAGSTPFRVMRTITLRSVAPNIAAALVLVVWFGLAMFAVPVIIGTSANINILTVEIVDLINFSYPPQLALAVGLSIFVVVPIALARLLQDRISRRGNFARVGGRGARIARIRLGVWKYPFRAGMVLYLLLVGVLPILALVLTAMNGFWTADIHWSRLNLDAFSRVLGQPSSIAAIRNSLVLAAGVGLLAVLFSALMSSTLRHRSTVVARVLDAVIRVPVAVSSFVLVVGMILAFAGPPFRLEGTLVLFVLGYLAVCIPQASVATDSAAGQVGSDMIEASMIAGSSKGRTFRKIELPLMMPGLVSGWTLTFVVVAGDINVSALLGSDRTPVVGFQLLTIYNANSFSDLAALAVLLTVITSAGVLLGGLAGRLLGSLSGRRRIGTRRLGEAANAV